MEEAKNTFEGFVTKSIKALTDQHAEMLKTVTAHTVQIMQMTDQKEMDAVLSRIVNKGNSMSPV
jgi:hypothetical protein